MIVRELRNLALFKSQKRYLIITDTHLNNSDISKSIQCKKYYLLKYKFDDAF